MKSLKSFEPPKNGEKIFLHNDGKVFMYLGLCIFLTWLITHFLQVFFKYTDSVDWILKIGVFLFLMIVFPVYILGDTISNKIFFGGPIDSVYFFDEYLQINKEKFPFQVFDNFISKENGSVTISFIDLKYNEDSEFNIFTVKHYDVSQKLKINGKFKNVNSELIDFLNSKIKRGV